MSKLHPLEAVDFDLTEYWLKLIPGYTRTDEYHNPIHKELIRPRYNDAGPLPSMVVLSGGERSGKSRLGAAHLFATHWFGKTFWIVGERYDDTRSEFEFIRDAAAATGQLAKDGLSEPQNGPCHLKFKNGAEVWTKSSDDFTTLAGASPDGILMVEAGRQSYQAFRYLWTRATHATGWLLVSGTFEQTKGPWFRDLWNLCQGANEFGAKSVCLPSYANPEVYPDGANDPKLMAIRQTMTEEEFAERFLGIPRAPLGIVFPEFRRSSNVLPSATFQPMYPIRLWVDPGYHPSSYAVLFVQIVNGQIRIIKEYYTNTQLRGDMVLSEFSRLPSLTTGEMAELVVNDDLFEYVDRMVIDIAANAHAGAQDPTVETWRRELAKTGRAIPIRSKYVKIADGLKRTHDKLRINPITRQPWLLVNSSCENTIWEFEEGYRFGVRPSGEYRTVETPMDKNNHAMKAIAYGIIDEFGVAEGRLLPPPPSTRRPMTWDKWR